MIRTTATGLLFVWVVTAPIPAAALGPDQLAVIVNTADSYSVEVGEYYARRRIPRANVIPITLPAGQAAISREDFEAGKAQLDARVPATVQALALAWTTPFRVDCTLDHHRVRVRLRPGLLRRGPPAHAAEPVFRFAEPRSVPRAGAAAGDTAGRAERGPGQGDDRSGPRLR